MWRDKYFGKVTHHNLGLTQGLVLPHLVEESSHQGPSDIEGGTMLHTVEVDLLGQRGQGVQVMQGSIGIDEPHAFLQRSEQIDVALASQFQVDQIHHVGGLLNQRRQIGRIGRPCRQNQ